MGFIKHGDGKIVSVLDEEELTDEQKKAVKDLSKQNIKVSDDRSASEKKSGR
jgi:hypothetical protein